MGRVSDMHIKMQEDGLIGPDGVKINTYYDPPPIPDRRYDWVAMKDGYEPGDPIGFGETEYEARNDIIGQLAGFEEYRGFSDTRFSFQNISPDTVFVEISDNSGGGSLFKMLMPRRAFAEVASAFNRIVAEW